jgi:trehalose 6-phosphate phosphatase
LPIPPVAILREATFFLDLDGTLFDLVDRPDDVRADLATQNLLEQLNAKLNNRLVIVSGRSLQQIDEILGPCARGIAVFGSHGCEHRWRGSQVQPAPSPAVDVAADRFRDFAQHYPGMIVEEKSFGVALHYRMAPHAEPAARTLAGRLARELRLYLQEGKMMVELRLAGGDKGGAVHRLMPERLLAGTTPVFAGDDLTDEPGFAAALEHGGHAILVGEPRGTNANYWLPSPQEFRNWLRRAVA